MGWLFGKKRPPVAPLPKGASLDENSLRFPSTPPPRRVIEPNEVKEAVGFSKPIVAPEEEQAPKEMVEEPAQMVPPMRRFTSNVPFYIKLEVYQRILGEINEVKNSFSEMVDATRKLENSEFNEESNFEKLKKAIKAIHDQALKVDKVLFKSQGD